MKLWPTLGVAFLLITSMRLSWSLAGERQKRSAGQHPEKYRRHTEYHQRRGTGYAAGAGSAPRGNQQRNQDGEVRREQLRNDIAKDECAHALPDARFTDRLRRHAERARASAVSPAYTADADHAGNASPLPDPPTWGNLGIWGDRLLDALETCNADKRAIAELDRE
ncbi:Uncharacterised protein [Escherichia coli]|nr:Uncharacterised protein [Escherichia coli]